MSGSFSVLSSEHTQRLEKLVNASPAALKWTKDQINLLDRHFSPIQSSETVDADEIDIEFGALENVSVPMSARTAVYLSRRTLIAMDFALSRMTDRLTHIEHPQAQSAQRKNNSQLYFDQMYHDLNVIYQFFDGWTSFESLCGPYTDSLTNHGATTEWIKIISIQHYSKLLLAHNFQDTNEPIPNESKKLLAYLRRDLCDMLECLDLIKEQVTAIKRVEYVPKSVRTQIIEVLQRIQRSFKRLEQFLIRPEEVEIMRRQRFGFGTVGDPVV